MPRKTKQAFAAFVSIDSGSSYDRIYLLQSMSMDGSAETQEISDLGLSDADYAFPEVTKKSGTMTLNSILAQDLAADNVGFFDWFGWWKGGTELTIQIIRTKQTGTGVDAVVVPITAADLAAGTTEKYLSFDGIVTNVTQGTNVGEYATYDVTLATRGEPTVSTLTATTTTA
jgi:hypothetical protein